MSDEARACITRLESLLMVAEREGAVETSKEIKSIIDTIEKFNYIIPF